MANEATFNVTAQMQKNGWTSGPFNFSVSPSVTGNNVTQQTQSIPTSATAINFALISGAPQKVLIVNLDTTNYVEVAGDSGITQFAQKLTPGDWIVLSPESATMYAKANTAAVLIGVFAIPA